MSKRKVFYNGEFVDESEAKISIYDSALMFGDMVFEMTRSFNKKQFKLREHLDRLFSGIKILRIPIQYSKDEMEDFCHEVVRVNEELFESTDEHRLMINVSRGPLGIYSHLFDDPKPTVIIADFPLKWTVVGMGKLFDCGVNGVVTKQMAIPHYYLDPRIKNRSRLHYQMANIEASSFKGENNWPILLDQDGFITEGSGDNLFFIKDDIVMTPKGHNILRGISRDYVFSLCKELGLECREEDISLYDAYNADECFMTATPFCILPVSSINYIELNTMRNQLWRAILDRWSKNVGVDIIEQIKAFNLEHQASKSGATPYQFKK
jgi:branched-chain amino acid aminotransferase